MEKLLPHACTLSSNDLVTESNTSPLAPLVIVERKLPNLVQHYIVWTTAAGLMMQPLEVFARNIGVGTCVAHVAHFYVAIGPTQAAFLLSPYLLPMSLAAH